VGSMTKIIAIVFGIVTLTSCDDEDHADLIGGGPGSSDPNSIVAGDGFCGPQGGSSALGQASFNSGVTTAKLDLDGNPLGQGQDPDWNPETSGQVNGQAVNSAKYAYVVMSRDQMNASGVSLGDWASVTNPATGQSVYARVEDKGPPGGTGEISQAAASAVGIQQVVVQTKEGPSTVPVGNPSVVVQAFAGTSSIQGDCAQLATNS
jgi:hypothetical protein